MMIIQMPYVKNVITFVQNVVQQQHVLNVLVDILYHLTPAHSALINANNVKMHRRPVLNVLKIPIELILQIVHVYLPFLINQM